MLWALESTVLATNFAAPAFLLVLCGLVQLHHGSFPTWSYHFVSILLETSYRSALLSAPF